MTNMASKIFQKIACMLGVMHNANVRHIESLMHKVVSLWFIKVSLIKLIQEFIVVVGGGISYVRWEVL